MNLEIPENALVAWLSPAIGVVLLAMQAWLGRQFATIGDLSALGTRVAGLEARAEKSANHEDVVEIERRLSVLESGLGEIRGELKGLGLSTRRIEHLVQLLVQAHLPDEGGRGAQ